MPKWNTRKLKTGLPPVLQSSFYTYFNESQPKKRLLAVLSLALFFYFLLILIFTILLGKRIFKSNLVGILSALAVGFNKDIIIYAISGASESPFLFEIVASAYFLTLRKRWATIVGFILLVLMYFTRPQAFIYIAGLILYWLLLNFKIKKAILLFGFALIVGFLIDYIVMPRFTGRYFLYSVTGRGITTITQVSAGGSASDSLRGVTVAGGGILSAVKKTFYNLYNFYKLAPQIINPYLLVLFVIGLFKWRKDKVENSLKGSIIFMAVATLMVAALSIPFFRYIHPIIPLVYIMAVGTLVWAMEQIKKSKKFVILASAVLILIFGVGQTLGVIFLDSRFERNTHNVGKPPVYVVLSRILKDNTSPNQIIVTNLDTWGSWYGERKTVWYPLTPEQIIPPKGKDNPFDAIFLTSYLMDDENYYMGPEWRRIFENPTNFSTKDYQGCEFIKENYKLGGVYKVAASEDYERQDAKAVLLLKK